MQVRIFMVYEAIQPGVIAEKKGGEQWGEAQGD